MGKHSRKSPHGKNWQSSIEVTSGPSRQRTRAVLRQVAWAQMSQPPIRDDMGIIPRWVRRAMALGLARKMGAAGRQVPASKLP